MIAGMFINMRLIDKETHRVLLNHSVDGQVHITLTALAEQVGCCQRTVHSSLDRLVTCGKVKRLGHNVRRGGMVYEVRQ